MDYYFLHLGDYVASSQNKQQQQFSFPALRGERAACCLWCSWAITQRWTPRWVLLDLFWATKTRSESVTFDFTLIWSRRWETPPNNKWKEKKVSKTKQTFNVLFCLFHPTLTSRTVVIPTRLHILHNVLVSSVFCLSVAGLSTGLLVSAETLKGEGGQPGTDGAKSWVLPLNKVNNQPGCV